MPEVVAPINATSTSTVAAPKAEPQAPASDKPRTIGQLPIEQKSKPKGEPNFKSKVEETLWRVNEPTAEEVAEEKSMNEIIDGAVKSAEKPSKETGVSPERSEPTETEETDRPKGKEKLLVRGKEVEVDYDHMKRLAQIGADSQLKNRDTANTQKQIQKMQEEVMAAHQEVNGILQALKTGNIDILVDLHGEDKARELAESFLRPRIEREMMPPEERRILDSEERAKKAEAKLADIEKRNQEAEIDQQAKHFEDHYKKTILEALGKGGFPEKADLTPFAREMASWMERGLSKGIEYTPEQLVSLVKEDNNLRVRSLTHVYVSQIEDAKKRGDSQAVETMGEKLVEVLGEPVMYAIGKYHLAKLSRMQPAVPKQILDTPKVPVQQAKKPKPYMTEDEYAAERRRRVEAMERGEQVPDWD